MISNFITAVFTVTCLLLTFRSEAQEIDKPWIPIPKPNDNGSWMELHEGFVNNTKANGSKIKIVFTGSSSIAKWSTTGKEIWEAKYAPLGAVNYGIGGDQIQHLLWRITNGEIDNLNPKMVVVYCGSNNVPKNPSNDDILYGINVTLTEIFRRLPDTKVLYVNFNPRGDKSGRNITLWERLVDMNEQMTQLADGKKLFVFEMFDDLIDEWGKINEDLYMPDKLHQNEDGYKLWDTLWEETFFRVWNSST